jgi:hypothetical protein
VTCARVALAAAMLATASVGSALAADADPS